MTPELDLFGVRQTTHQVIVVLRPLPDGRVRVEQSTSVVTVIFRDWRVALHCALNPLETATVSVRVRP